uniref:Uncharacterized protein n=1 Tax=Oryza punctata TaxID=4537 RepID=A0A0E0M0Q8_ORYPU
MHSLVRESTTTGEGLAFGPAIATPAGAAFLLGRCCVFYPLPIVSPDYRLVFYSCLETSHYLVRVVLKNYTSTQVQNLECCAVQAPACWAEPKLLNGLLENRAHTREGKKILASPLLTSFAEPKRAWERQSPGGSMDQDCDDDANQVGIEEEKALNGMGENVDNADNMVEQEESSGSAPNPLFLGTRPKRLRSKVWDAFKPIYIDGKHQTPGQVQPPSLEKANATEASVSAIQPEESNGTQF